jgi:hypothetical protein
MPKKLNSEQKSSGRTREKKRMRRGLSDWRFPVGGATWPHEILAIVLALLSPQKIFINNCLKS